MRIVRASDKISIPIVLSSVVVVQRPVDEVQKLAKYAVITRPEYAGHQALPNTGRGVILVPCPVW